MESREKKKTEREGEDEEDVEMKDSETGLTVSMYSAES